MNPTDGVISEAFDQYKKHFGHLVVVALVVYVAIAILSVLLVLIGGWGRIGIDLCGGERGRRGPPAGWPRGRDGHPAP